MVSSVTARVSTRDAPARNCAPPKPEGPRAARVGVPDPRGVAPALVRGARRLTQPPEIGWTSSLRTPQQAGNVIQPPMATVHISPRSG